MSNKNVTIKLKSKRDRDGQTIYFGKMEAPVLIDCREGVTFLVFVSDQGDEQLQIALMNSKKSKKNTHSNNEDGDSFEDDDYSDYED